MRCSLDYEHRIVCFLFHSTFTSHTISKRWPNRGKKRVCLTVRESLFNSLFAPKVDWMWHTVRLGKSGLKVSRIILGCMSYGSPDWQAWVLPDEEGLKHIKAAWVAMGGTGDKEQVWARCIGMMLEYRPSILRMCVATIYGFFCCATV